MTSLFQLAVARERPADDCQCRRGHEGCRGGSASYHRSAAPVCRCLLRYTTIISYVLSLLYQFFNIGYILLNIENILRFCQPHISSKHVRLIKKNIQFGNFESNKINRFNNGNCHRFTDLLNLNIIFYMQKFNNHSCNFIPKNIQYLLVYEVP